MIRYARTSLGAKVLALAVLAASAIALQAAEAPAAVQDEGKENVAITVRIGALEDGRRVPVKSYTLIVAAGSPGSKLLAGERVPFPSAVPKPSDDGGDADGMTSFVYQNIGFVTEARAWIVDDKKIRLAADIEESRVRQGAEGEPPTVETRQLAVTAILTDGVPLELTRAEGVTDRSGFVEIEAKILR